MGRFVRSQIGNMDFGTNIAKVNESGNIELLKESLPPAVVMVNESGKISEAALPVSSPTTAGVLASNDYSAIINSFSNIVTNNTATVAYVSTKL